LAKKRLNSLNNKPATADAAIGAHIAEAVSVMPVPADVIAAVASVDKAAKAGATKEDDRKATKTSFEVLMFEIFIISSDFIEELLKV